ncbi:MAG: hypothetical protein F6K28_00165 [Microcoleus sp. SIO2G3]|jgi:hypothetical protein|nr:hypothetical protein [Microcoleus sp. SIO2G3]
MNLNEIQASMQQQLEEAGVPTNQAREAANVLAQENALTLSGQPSPDRTPEQQHIVSSAYEWFKAKQQ